MSLCHDFAVALSRAWADLEADALHMCSLVLHCPTAEAAPVCHAGSALRCARMVQLASTLFAFMHTV